MNDNPVVLVSAVRTAMGHFGGRFKDIPAPILGSHVIRAVTERAQCEPNIIDAVLMGCVLSAGLGQAPARQAALGAGLSNHTPCTTVNKMCGSGIETIVRAHDAILAGSSAHVIAGGMENMSRAPYLLQKARFGYRLGHHQIMDHMMLDGLEDAYENKSMGVYAEKCAAHYHFSRAALDEFATTSLLRAKKSNETGLFSAEIVGVEGLAHDEHAMHANPEKLPHLKPAFIPTGVVTAANSSAISDGAAAVLLMRASEAERLKLKPLATIIAHSTYAQEPGWFTTAPIYAIQNLLKKINWTIADVDLFEINEAFAAVPMAAMETLSVSHDKVNIHGGACALGHPIGASGARIVVTLLYALRQKKLKRGVAAICIGGGEAIALAVEINREII